MQTPADFIQVYLRENREHADLYFQQQIPFLRKFFSDDYLKIIENAHTDRQNNPETFESTDSFEATAKVITVENWQKRQQRYRYHLRVAGDNWQIYVKETECFLCRGTRGKSSCKICGGVGWRDYQKPVS
jgi:hypothetical protein